MQTDRSLQVIGSKMSPRGSECFTKTTGTTTRATTCREKRGATASKFTRPEVSTKATGRAKSALAAGFNNNQTERSKSETSSKASARVWASNTT